MTNTGNLRFSSVRSPDSARCSTFYLSYLMIRPPVTFSSMSHRVMKIPLTPFSWLDASDTGYWYKTSSCRHTQAAASLSIETNSIVKITHAAQRGKQTLVSFSIAECEISELGCYQMLSAINYGEKKRKNGWATTQQCHFGSKKQQKYVTLKTNVSKHI